MRGMVLFFACLALGRAEDLLSRECANNGNLATCIAVPANQWTDISFNSGSTTQITLGLLATIYTTRYDKSHWVPAINGYCDLGSWREVSSEPNRVWQCLNPLENRLQMWNFGGTWHAEDFGEGGHPMGIPNVDPKTSVAMGQYGYSGSQATDNPRFGNYIFDFYGQAGRTKQTATSLSKDNQLGSAAYDVANDLLIGIGGVANTNAQPTWALDPATNVLNTAWPVSGTFPAQIQNQSMTYDSVDGCIYMFGGGPTTSSVSTGLYKYCGSTTGGTWTRLDTTQTCNVSIRTGVAACPSARESAGWAFDRNENKFFLFGGCDQFSQASCGVTSNGSHVLEDTWMYDPASNAWTEQNPACSPAANCLTTLGATGPFSQPGDPALENLVWVPELDLFLFWVNTSLTGANRPHFWAYRYAAGGHVGLKSTDYSKPGSGYTQDPSLAEGALTGSLNRNTSATANGLSQTWAQQGSIGSDGTTLYQTWAEFTAAYTGTNSGFSHPYAQKWDSATGKVLLGNSPYSMMQDTPPAPANQAYDAAIAPVGGPGGTPWACWHQLNDSVSREQVWCASWDGANWQPSQVGPVDTGTGAAHDSYPVIADVNGTPTVAMRESDGNAPSAATSLRPTLGYVLQWNGSAWTPLNGTGLNGKALNADGTAIDSLSIASDGAAPWVAYTQYTPTLQTISGVSSIAFSQPQVLLSKWNGAAWAPQCGGDGRVSTSERAFSAAVTVMAGIPYVAFVERTDGSTRTSNSNQALKLYVRQCSGGTWSTVGSGYLNRDQTYGWASRAEITNDGTNLYVTWHEQGNDQPWVAQATPYPAWGGSFAQKPKVFVSQWNGSAWTALGGALNADPANGAATHPSIAMLNGQPVVQWGETNLGNLRQVYVKRWNGADWAGLSPTALTLANGSLPGATVGAVYSQDITSWASGGTPPYNNWAVASGSLPTGCSLNSSGVISGTVGGAPGTSTFTLRVSDSAGSPATATSGTISLTVNAPPDITTPSPLPNGTVGALYNQTLTSTDGTAPVTWDLSAGSLPQGLTLSLAGIMSGTPTQAGTFGFNIRITDAASSAHSEPFQLTIAGLGSPSVTISGSAKISGNAKLQ